MMRHYIFFATSPKPVFQISEDHSVSMQQVYLSCAFSSLHLTAMYSLFRPSTFLHALTFLT